MLHYYVEALRNQLQRERETLTEALAKGAAADYESYQRVVGVLHGLALAEQHAIEQAAKLEKADDDDLDRITRSH